MTLDAQLEISGLYLSWPDAKLKLFAEARSSECKGFLAASGGDVSVALERGLQLLARFEIIPPDNKELDSQFSRLCCPSWWLRRIRRKKDATLESAARNIGLVSKMYGGYCSNIGVRERQFQKKRNQDWLDSTKIRDADGNELLLSEVAKHNISNPAVRRAELMTRIRGFEEVANLYGDCAEFYTFTCPSRFHAYHAKSGKRNKKFAEGSIKDAHSYLCEQWKLIRSALHRHEIFPYGIRVVEPHHDGTPHWHVLLFVEPSKREAMRDICQRYALQDSPDERGARIHRFKAEAIDPNRGSAVGYIAKYIAKNIDGEHVDKDLYGMDAKHSAVRIEAWAANNGIRQFQTIGGPSITIWRELRRLKQELSNSDIEPARQAADSSNFAAFIIAMGGPHLKRKLRPLKPCYEPSEHTCLLTGEISPAKNKYGEDSPPKLVGVCSPWSIVKTRLIRWTRIPKTQPLRGGGIERGAAPPIPPPRSGLGLV